jgi:hypothetical protein
MQCHPGDGDGGGRLDLPDDRDMERRLGIPRAATPLAHEDHAVRLLRRVLIPAPYGPA